MSTREERESLLDPRVKTVPHGEFAYEYESVYRWIMNLPKPFFRQNGKERYHNYLPEFVNFLDWLNGRYGEDWSPDDLVKLRMEQLRDDDMATRRWMEERLKEYKKSVLSSRLATRGPRIGQPISDSSVNHYIVGIASFFRRNYVRLTEVPIKRRPRRVIKDYWFKRGDLKAMHEVASPWERAYITTELTLGFRRWDSVSLKWSDVWPYIVEAEGEAVGPVVLYTEKYDVESRSFFSPDSIKDLKRLRVDQNRTGRLGAYIFRRGDEDIPIDDAHANRRIQILFKRAGLESHGLTVRSHCLRKMLFNELKNVGAPVDVRKIIVGKVVGEDIRAYTDDEVKQWFLKVLPRISLEEIVPESAKELRRRIDELERQVGEMQAAHEMIQRILQRRKEWEKRAA